MKRFIVLFISLIFMLSCASGGIQVKKDSFKNSTVITMDMDHEVSIEGGGFFKGITAYGGQYSKEIQNGVMTPTTIFFKFIVSTNVNDLTQEAYIKVDDSTTKLKLTDISSGVNTSSGKSTELNIETGKLEQKEKTTSNKTLSGKITLTKDIEKAILNSKEVQFRLYSMNDPITLKVSPTQLVQLKKFLKTTGEEK